MTLLRLTADDPTTVEADAVVVGVGVRDGAPVLAPGATEIDAAMGGRLLETLAAAGVTGRPGEPVRIPTLGTVPAPLLVATGLGEPRAGRAPRWDPEPVRRAVGAAVRSLAGSGHAVTGLAAAAARDGVRAVAEGAVLGGYAFRRYRRASAGTVKDPLATLTIRVPDPKDRATQATLRRATIIGDGVALVRDLVNTPACDLHPADFAAVAVATVDDTGVETEVLDEKALRAGGYGGILGVGAGAANPPRLVRLTWPGGRRPRARVHLVGKGITFDSGGLSLKPPKQMETMKCDMAGAAAVLATVWCAARLKLPVAVTGWCPLAENLPGGSAIRPSDVLTMRGGRTVEVLNTDAEGRLVMADAIARAGEEHPDVIVDVATLTGSQLVALGSRVFAIMGDDAVRQALVKAAEAAGEAAWPMPLPPELRASLDSALADIANTGDRYGGMLVAGLFLKEFVADGIGWAHLDIAGPAFNETEPWGYTPKGGTGVTVRTFVEWLEGIAGSGQ